VVRFYHAWSFQFARLPSFSKPFWALWSELVAVVVVVAAETVAWEYRVQLLPGLQVYATESAIYLSGAFGEPFRQQVVRPRSSSWSRLWQSLQPLVEGVVVDCCWILRVLQLPCRRGFVTDFAKYC
jgi:hypothetical protein